MNFIGKFMNCINGSSTNIINTTNPNNWDNDDSIYSDRTVYNPTIQCKIRLDVINEGEKSEKMSEISFNDEKEISINIYRFKFSEKFTNELYNFSKIHQYDERKQFKEAWNVWVEENNELVTEEVRRLYNLGYDGDVMDKMYKSARYYFRKKSTVKNDPKPRKTYISLDKELLNAMDKHIINNINNEDFKPSDGFSHFCKENMDLLKNSITILCKQGMTDSNEIKEKIKKTYKNRYFLVIS